LLATAIKLQNREDYSAAAIFLIYLIFNNRNQIIFDRAETSYHQAIIYMAGHLDQQARVIFSSPAFFILHVTMATVRPVENTPNTS